MLSYLSGRLPVFFYLFVIAICNVAGSTAHLVFLKFQGRLPLPSQFGFMPPSGRLRLSELLSCARDEVLQLVNNSFDSLAQSAILFLDRSDFAVDQMCWLR